MVINRELTAKHNNYGGKSKTKLKKSRVPYDMVNKIRKELHYKLQITSDPDGLAIFTSTVKIDTNVYTGKGLTKSTSRIQTMMTALSNICKINTNFINYKENMTYNLYMINSRLYYNAGRITTDDSDVKTYTAIVYFNGKKYVGKGSTMAIAKLYAAAALLSNPRDVYIERIPFLKTAQNIKPRTSNGLANKLLSIRENLNFRVLQTPHSKNSSHYVVSVVIDGKKFIGKADTMEMARIKSITIAFNNLKYLHYKDLKKPENAQAFVLYQLRIQFYYNYVIPKRTKLGKLYTAFIYIYGQTYVGKGYSRLVARMRATAAALCNSNNRISDVVFDSLQYNIYYDHNSFKSTISTKINDSLRSVQNEFNFKLIKKCKKYRHSNQILYQISVQVDEIEMTGEGVGFDKAKINAIVNALKHMDNRKNTLEIATPKNEISSIIYLIRNDLIYNTKSYKNSFESILFVTTVKIKNKIFIGYNLNKETSKLYAAAATICDIIAPERTIRFNNHQGRQLNKIIERKTDEKPMEIVEITDDDGDDDKNAINKKHLLFTENIGSSSYKLISLFECIENLQKSIEIMKLPNSIIDYDRPKLNLEEIEVSIEVNNERYIGKGETEEDAKKIATLNAIKYLFNNITNELIEIAKINIIENAQKEIPNTNPIALLSELNENVKYEIYLPALAENQQWKIIANVNGQIFEGKGNESKLAKQAAAKSALAKLYNISYSPMRMPQLDDKIKYSDYELSQSLADHIGKLVIDKFESLTFTVELFNRRKVLAGIVMTENLNENSAKVIAITTGSKIVNDYSNINDNTIIYDLHAEILSRRCLIRFLYDQLELFFKTSENESIFEKSLDNKLLKLKDGIDFHLYISTAPCGDACGYFTKHSVTEIESLHKHIKGKLQIKIELGDGAIPLDDDFKQENQIAIMSCSDKIAKWNVVGIQGALLSTIIKPIYLKSIVLGNILNPIDIYRSNCGRFENVIGKLPQFYHLNKPKYALLTSTEMASTIHSPDFAINWYIGCKLIEIINASNGKVIKSNDPSHLTQFDLFEKYQKLISHNQLYFNNIDINRNYRKMKESAMDYQMAKNELYSTFVGIGLGEWVKKVY